MMPETTEGNLSPISLESPNSRHPGGLLLLFFGSGCAALIYEIVWFQMLQLVIGSSAVSLAVLLGTFMGGMCLGSLLLPRYISRGRHPLRVYAFLELGVGLLGLLVLFAMPWVVRAYTPFAVSGFLGIFLRGVVAAVCLLPATVLMGATLPAVSRWVESSPRAISWLGLFYGGNIAGAVFGSLLSGFYLLRVHDMAITTYTAVAINAVVGILALAWSQFGAYSAETLTPPSASAAKSPPNRALWVIYVAIGISGLCALAAEVVWTRLLSLLLGATVYTFSIILAVFLTGLGIGSSLGSFWSRSSASPRRSFALCQLLLGAAIAWTSWMLARSLPYWPVEPILAHNPWFIFQLDLARCCWALLPATILWGASFPLALAAAATPSQDSGKLVGGVYAANTIGAIFGAVGASLLLIGWAGTQHTQRILIGLSMANAALLILADGKLSSDASAKSRSILPKFGALLAGTALAIALIYTLPAIPWGLVAQGRNLAAKGAEGKMLFVGEGFNASVAVTELSSGIRNFHVSGKIEASTEPLDMRLQRMLGHLPALLHPNPRSVLIVGCGAGVTAGSFIVHSNIERIVICEIEPLIPRVVAEYFGRENYGVVNNPRVQVIYDDARHYVLTTREKFDIITSDPIHPWVKGAATLYTKEYFELCRQHLNPGGLVTQWVPLYESNLAVVQSEIGTFFNVFPHGTVWSNDDHGAGYDVVLLGQNDPLKINPSQMQRRLDDNSSIAQSLNLVGFNSAYDLLLTYAGQASDLVPWLEHAEINHDRNLRLQYLAGMGVNNNQEGSIFDDMLLYRQFPEKIFAESAPQTASLQKMLKPRKAEK